MPSKICFVRPPTIDLAYAYNTFACPPIGVAYLAGSAIAAGHTVSCVDAVGEAPTKITPLDDPHFSTRGLTTAEIVARVPADTDVLGVTCMFSQDWPYVRSMLRALREAFPRAVIVVGGEHVTALPEFVLGEGIVDHCVLGEGEETFVELLAALEQGRPAAEVAGVATRVDGRVVLTPRRARIRGIDEIAPPAWDICPIENYLAGGYGFGINRGRNMPIIATRGCPYQCTFCSSPSMWTTRWTARDPACVLEEIRGYMERYGAQNFDFYDLTAIIRRDWIVRFCQLVEASGLRFTWQLPTGTRSEAIDDEVAELLYRTGCRNLTYAPESGSSTELGRIKKKIKLENFRHSIRACVREGLYVKANLVLGFAGQTRREVLETVRFAIVMALLGVRDVMFSLFSPYPGSEMYRELRKAGKIGEPSDEYFLSLTCYTDVTRAVSWTEHLSARELGLWRIVGLLVFYTVNFTVRPWRVLQVARNVVFGRQESILDRAMIDFTKRAFRSRRSQVPAGELETLPTR